jgi:cell division cycle 20-like protein 1 (cofactor of APC complex)
MFHSEYEARLKSPSKVASPPSKQSPTSPSKSSPITSPKKDNYSDRFIPLSTAQDVGTSFSLLQSPPNDKSTDALKDNQSTYNLVLKSELLGSECVTDMCVDRNEEGAVPRGAIAQPRNILRYKSRRKLSLGESPYSLSPMSLESQKLLSSPRKPPRKIPKVPFKVLEAPQIQDDFYLNLVDWSSQNVVAVGLANSVYLWNAATSQVTKLCELPGDVVTSVAWLQRGTHLAVGSNHGVVQLWDVTRRKQIREMAGHKGRVGALGWNAHILSSGSRDKTIFHRDVRMGTPFVAKLIGHRQEVCGLKWSYDGQHLASGGNDNKLYIWDSASTSPILKFQHHTAAVKAIAWSPHQRGLLASGGGTADKCIRFWSTITGSPLHYMDTGSQVCNLAWSKNVNELVSTHGYSQNQVVVWSYPSMTQIATLMGHTMRVLYLAVSPDGQTIVTGAGDETLRFWNVFPDAKESNYTTGTISSILHTHTDIR